MGNHERNWRQEEREEAPSWWEWQLESGTELVSGLISILVTSNVRSFLGLFFVASLAAGCSEASSAPTSPSSVIADQLAGTWNVLSSQANGQLEQATPTNASYTLTFAGRRLSTQVDCNTCSGNFTLSGQTLTAGPTLACTRASCPTAAFESAYISLLSGESSVTLSGGGTLVLSSARGVLRFTR